MFDIFDDFSKWSALKALQNFEKSSNMAKIWQQMKKSLVQPALNKFFQGTSKPQNLGFGYPIYVN